jgi:ATP-dependent DNA helicase PIF1
MIISPIQSNHAWGDLIRQTAVFIWDEVTMANQAVFACVEETCRRVMENDEPFGGKIFVLLGDFRQTCPVIWGGSKQQIIDACIKSSPLWSLFDIRPLIHPRRNADDPDFAEFVDVIGDGAGPDIALDHMIDIVTEPNQLIDFVYPGNTLHDGATCLKCSILAPTNAQVDYYNDTILGRLTAPTRTYMAADSLQEAHAVGLTSPDSALNYVTRQTPPGLPSHSLTIKVGGVYRLLHNFSLDRQLVKNVCVVVVDIGAPLVTVRLICPSGVPHDEDILIPQIPFTYVWPFGPHTYPMTIPACTCIHHHVQQLSRFNSRSRWNWPHWACIFPWPTIYGLIESQA